MIGSRAARFIWPGVALVVAWSSLAASAAPMRLIAPSEVWFSCSDIYSHHPLKATLVGRVPLLTHHDYNLNATLEALFVYEEGTLKEEHHDLELQGQGFLTGTGGTQFDLQSRLKIGGQKKLQVQVSLKNDSEIVFSYLWLGEKKYRTICSIVKDRPDFARRSKIAKR